MGTITIVNWPGNRQGWRRAAQHSAGRLGAGAGSRWVRIGRRSTGFAMPPAARFSTNNLVKDNLRASNVIRLAGASLPLARGPVECGPWTSAKCPQSSREFRVAGGVQPCLRYSQPDA
jgi:hypothetical protein